MEKFGNKKSRCVLKPIRIFVKPEELIYQSDLLIMIEPSVLLPGLLFYVFAAILVLSSLIVVLAKNPVHSVMFLILSFFNAAGLFVLLGAEFIAMLLVIVYVGAVAVLFLFVIMMLNVNYERLRQGFVAYLPVGLLVALVLLSQLVMIIQASAVAGAGEIINIRMGAGQSPVPVDETISNIQAIGMLVYTDYVFAFQMSGVILLVAMVGAIVLTLRVRPGVKKQSIGTQVARDPKRAIKIVQVDVGKGV